MTMMMIRRHVRTAQSTCTLLIADHEQLGALYECVAVAATTEEKELCCSCYMDNLTAGQARLDEIRSDQIRSA